jgi:hypothetical protein
MPTTEELVQESQRLQELLPALIADARRVRADAERRDARSGNGAKGWTTSYTASQSSARSSDPRTSHNRAGAGNLARPGFPDYGLTRLRKLVRLRVRVLPY